MFIFLFTLPVLRFADHTSIKLRIDYWKNKSNQSHTDNMQPESLMPFVGNQRQPMPRGLIFNLIDYIELLDWTGRIIRHDKRGAISCLLYTSDAADE